MSKKEKIQLRTVLSSRLGRLFLSCLLLLSFSPLLFFAILWYNHSQNILKKDLEVKLNLAAGLEAEEISNYFQAAAQDIRHLAENKGIRQLLGDLKTAYKQNASAPEALVRSRDWQEIKGIEGVDLSRFQQDYAYGNIYLIDPEGLILFATRPNPDMGKHLFTGELADSRFSRTCARALSLDKVLYSDLELYPPAGVRPVSFLILAVAGENGVPEGLLALQLTTELVNSSLRRQLIAENYEISIIGPDKRMRFNSVHLENLGLEPGALVDTAGTRRIITRLQQAPEKEIGREFTSAALLEYRNHRGVTVVGTQQILDIYGVRLGIIVEMDRALAYQPLRAIIMTIYLIVAGTLVLALLVSLWLTKHINSPILFLTVWIKKIAGGDLTLRHMQIPDNEIGDMQRAFHKLIESTREFAGVCQAIARGEISRDVTLRGENDLMGQAINKIAANYRKAVSQAKKVTTGDYSTTLRPESEQDELGNALYNMISSLRYMHTKNNQENWLKTGINELTKEIQGSQRIEILCEKIIRFICMYLNLHVGVLYISRNNRFELASSYALSHSGTHPWSFAFGEGLIGQNAREKKIQIISDPPPGRLEIRSGLLDKNPAKIVLVPLVYEKSTVGVMELGVSGNMDELSMNFLQQISGNIAISINLAMVYDRLHASLKQMEKQKLQLQNQSEELRVSNEELEEQTIRLQESERRLQQQQEELRQTNEELEEHAKILKKQKEQLQRKTLEIAETAAELQRMSKYKSEFLANMSHELRTPLNSMLILARLLAENKSGHLSEKEVEFATTIFSSGNDLLNLINEILDLAKIEANKVNLSIQQVSIRDMVSGLVDVFEPVAATNKLNFETAVHPDVPEFIVTDEQRLLQILKNLLSNAFKFTVRGQVKLSVFFPKREAAQLGDKLDPARTLAFEVADTGIGIPQAKQDLIFEAFQQVDSGISRKYGGTGLGLSICRELSKLLKGEIRLHSVEKEGTRFTVFLPVSFEEEEKPAPQEQVINREQPPRKNQSEIQQELVDDRNSIAEGDNTILIVEDDRQFAEVLLNLTREHGFKGITAFRGDSALELVAQYHPGGILLDLSLPGVDGWSVLGRIKENINTRHIPVHIISGADKELQGLQMGAVGFLRKPVTLEQLNTAFAKIEKIARNKMRKLLVIEDNRDQLVAITNLLEGNDLEITTVESGNDAYRKLQLDSFDCIVLDLSLPDMSGFDLLKMVRMNEDISHIPIIIYTGKVLSDQERYELREYAETIIVKDADSLELLLDQTSLFLHRVENALSEQKKRIIKKLHNREEIFTGRRILIVDDDMRNVFALTAVLEENNLQVDIAKNGRECIDFLEKNPGIDLVLMDIMMPVMDGYEAIEYIRKMKQYHSVPIIALTAKAMKGDQEKCIQSGASDYMAKPVNNDQLLSLLRVWLYKG